MSAARDIDTPAPLLECGGLAVEVSGRVLVRDLNLAIAGGSITCILGCNGAGKTLTLHSLAGLREISRGYVKVGGQLLGEWDRRALARTLGLLMQSSEDAFPSSVIDTALIGRHPHIGFWQWESETDRELARAALAAVGMSGFAARDIATLSGGERRRVALAAMLTQAPDIFLLDEPINHLDPHHQIDVLRLFRQRAAAGASVMMSLHDAGLAARFSDHALLLFGNGEWLYGSTAEVLTEQTIERLYGLRVKELAWAGGRTFVADV
jgi:iron complex transport system ATP-binding protein